MGVADATRVERPDRLRDALESALHSPAPALLEIVVA
jgi:thiamine pyrophosphate-dependent acetolactate synthase large subunit-like protein